MNIRVNQAVLCAAALVSSAPAVTHAADTRALDRCVQIFVAEVIPSGRVADIRREDIRAAVRPITADRSKVTLIAQGEKSSKPLARASCVIGEEGVLVGMYLYETKSGPMANGRPKVLARNVGPTNSVRTAHAGDTKPF